MESETKTILEKKFPITFPGKVVNWVNGTLGWHIHGATPGLYTLDIEHIPESVVRLHNDPENKKSVASEYRKSLCVHNCPFCFNEDQDKSRYFYTKEDEPYRVDVCDKCKRYIKTFDERKVEQEGDVAMATRDVLTHYLDELAEKEGFQSAVWWFEYDKA